MKKKGLFILLLALLPSLSFSQITIDSMKVFSADSFIIDSIYVSGTSTGQRLDKVLVWFHTDACGSTFARLNFTGCGFGPSEFYDTTFAVGFHTRYITVGPVWDTSWNCTYPISPLSTDPHIWDICYPTMTNGVEASAHNQIHLYPNPAQHTVQLELPADIQVQRLSLSDVSGRMLRQYEPQQRSLEVTGLPPGLYFLRVESDRGAVVKRLVVD